MRARQRSAKGWKRVRAECPRTTMPRRASRENWRGGEGIRSYRNSFAVRWSLWSNPSPGTPLGWEGKPLGGEHFAGRVQQRVAAVGIFTNRVLLSLKPHFLVAGVGAVPPRSSAHHRRA